MIIIEKNLKELVEQFNICPKSLVDNFSLTVKLGTKIFRPKKLKPDGSEIKVTYGHTPDPKELFNEENADQNIILNSQESILCSSSATYIIPNGYFGLLQTKGTLARIFVSLSCNDGQVEPGFKGKITLEITNHSPWTIELPVNSEVGQLYIFKCSTNAEFGYIGRYADMAAHGPTIPIWQKIE